MNFITWEGLSAQQILAVDETNTICTGNDLIIYESILGPKLQGCHLAFLYCTNDRISLLNYLVLLHNGCVPLLLDNQMVREFRQQLEEIYHPDVILEGEQIQYRDEGRTQEACGEGLTLLLTTSGSTGSPKLIRLSRVNLLENACSIVKYLNLDKNERPVTSLPMYYTYGLSVIHSHLLVNATILLTSKSVMEPGFWSFVRDEKATSISGVPYTYQLLKRIGFLEWKLPYLRTLTQAGGHLPEELQQDFGIYCQNYHKKLFVMYGQTEATARMAYLPAEHVLDKIGSMGIPIPGGAFHLEDESGHTITKINQVGELIYTGSNVAMGYARNPQDLTRGDDWQGVLRTGDMASFDQDGYYYVAGRKKRFIKMYGKRISLDQMEHILQTQFGGVIACTGRDEWLSIWYEGDDVALENQMVRYLKDVMQIGRREISIHGINQLPRTASGKIQYQLLQEKTE